MKENITCEYCTYFAPSKPMREKVVEGEEKKKKKGPVKKRCVATNRKIEIDSPACEYFDPAQFFYCSKNNCQIAVIQCINRRKNDKQLKSFEDCEKCRQFENIIKTIAEEYWLSARKPLPPKKQIRRREKKESKIRRRRKPTKLRRRKQPESTIRRREKPTKIRRRS